MVKGKIKSHLDRSEKKRGPNMIKNIVNGDPNISKWYHFFCIPNWVLTKNVFNENGGRVVLHVCQGRRKTPAIGRKHKHSCY
jgi:hypothetical protein